MSKFISEGAAKQIDDIVRCAEAASPGFDGESFRSRVVERQSALLTANAERCRTDRARFLLDLSSLVLAAYQTLRDTLDDAGTVFDVLRQAFVEPRRPYVRDWLAERLKISPDAPGTAFEQAAENFKSGGEAYFGDSFRYVQEVQTPEQSFINVERCFFNDFFRSNGAPEVTRLFCALDVIWADELNEGDYNVDFHRPTILSAGDDKCRFQFTRRRTRS